MTILTLDIISQLRCDIEHTKIHLYTKATVSMVCRSNK